VAVVNMMNAEDGRIIETLRRDGIAVLRDLLSEAELGPIRAELIGCFWSRAKGRIVRGTSMGISHGVLSAFGLGVGGGVVDCGGLPVGRG